MKRVVRQSEPELLKNYAIACPNSTWQEMRDDAHFNGPEAYDACRAQIISDQGGICAFCEIDIRDNDPLKCRIEHFHPKSDVTPAHNWALDWNNMLGVCAGGSYAYTNAPWYLPPHT